MQTNKKKGLTVKDLVTIGIFSALFLVFALVGGIFFAPNPVLTFYMPVGSALLCGPIYLLMMAKVKKRFTATILGVIMCIIWFVTGMHLGIWSWVLLLIWWQVQGSIRVKRLIQFHIFCYHSEEQVLIWCSLQIQMVGQEPCLEMGQSSHI